MNLFNGNDENKMLNALHNKINTQKKLINELTQSLEKENKKNKNLNKLLKNCSEELGSVNLLLMKFRNVITNEHEAEYVQKGYNVNG